MTARQVIKKFFKKEGIELESSNIYSAREWRDRGEEWGRNSKLIIVHDGGDHAPYMNLDYGSHSLHDKLINFLRDHGYWMELCTGWYTAIYSLED